MLNGPNQMMRAALACLAACFLAGALAAPSLASGPELRLHLGTPDSVTAGEEVVLRIAIQNVGDSETTGPITLVDSFGSGIGAPQLTGEGTSSASYVPAGPTTCEPQANAVKCVAAGPLPPAAQLFLSARVKILPGASGSLGGEITVSGGGTLGQLHDQQRMVVGPPGPFAFTVAAAELLNADGSPDTQAASDPAEFTTSLQWSSFFGTVLKLIPTEAPVEHFKDVVAHLPPGLIGNPSATPALCTPNQLGENYPGTNSVANCPVESQIGVARVNFGGLSTFTGLYNMVAPYGVATELGFQLFKTNVLLDAYVRPGDHGIDIVSRDTTTSVPIPGVDITVWGDPSDSSHDRYRGPCLANPYFEGPDGQTCPSDARGSAFLRMPTSCSSKPLEFGAESNSYEHKETWISKSFTGPTMTGCDAVPFAPQITVDPTGTASSSPTGVSVKLSLPQNKDPEGLAEADLKKAVVTLPEGMAINPSAADGLEACQDAQLHLDSNTPAECPEGSKIGTVLLHTQLIPNPIEGSIYIRPQNSNDPMSGEMFRLVVELRDDSHGLDFKLLGEIQANPSTGRLTTTFDENPQFPFEDISLQFKAGARAPLVTPASCTTQTTEAQLSSWAQPSAPVDRASGFQLTSGPNGSACPGATLPFNPGFSAGVGNVEAGSFTPFLTTFTRGDADQGMGRVSVTLPKGLLGSLAGLPLCPEPQASQGTCDAASEIGTVTAGAGAGPTPFYVTGGKVYMTGPYGGAPFGLSVVVPAKAGPFNLGTVVVRARVNIDPHTAQLTVTTDPLPQVVGGVPVDLRLVNVTINRPGFVFNPTDCDHSSILGTMTGVQGTSATVARGFQVTNCAALAFKPGFAVSTSGKPSRANGASLDVKLSYPSNKGQANIASVKVELPKQLPSRLTTLQKACTAATFQVNPAACPAASRIGMATATTPALPVALAGPAYFVSNGGEAFPDLIVVLQGEGVTVDLTGTTFISKRGITSSTFATVPDVPVGTFELKLPQGPYSALAANGNLCKAKLAMPTTFRAQDGKEIKQSTKIKVTGCPKARKAKRRRAQGNKRGGRSGGRSGRSRRR
jgi:hypothetical protein